MPIQVAVCGPSLAGKTTALMSAAAALGRRFDWSDDWLDVHVDGVELRVFRCRSRPLYLPRGFTEAEGAILRECDCTVFVWDAQRAMIEQAHWWLERLREHARADAPIVALVSKYDTPTAIPLEE